MNTRYSHTLADRTAITLVDFATEVLKLSAMMPGASCTLVLAYDDKLEVFASVERDDDGVYYFNSVDVGDLSQAIQIYSMMCVEIIKSVALDESCENFLEDINSLSDDESDNHLVSSVRSDSSFVHYRLEDDQDDQEIIENYAMEPSYPMSA